MQEVCSNSLLQSISESRFGPYRQPGDSAADGLARYLWNVALGESLYPVLQSLEVALRNSIHDAAAQAFGEAHWFDTIPVAQETRILTVAAARLRQANKTPRPDDLVAALPLGFWVNLFYSRYEQKLWPRLLKEVFPYIPAGIRRRNYISQRLNPIRHLRNRVFHHEPIWHWPDLAQHHQEALEVIGWINPELLALVQLLDRFPEVYAQGPERYFEELRRWGGRNA